MSIIQDLVATTPLGVRVPVPFRLGEVTTRGVETPPEDLDLSPRAVNRVWTAVEGLYRTGLHPGMSLVVRHRGQVVLDRAIGHRRLDSDELMTTDTPACLFSCSKVVTALIIHKLVEQNALALDDTVAQHIPEFAQNGKQDVTVRALLTHRAGIAKLPAEIANAESLFDNDRVLAALCAAPLSNADRQGYHASTAGYVLGEVARRASGRDLHELLRSTITEPLGTPNVTYGVPVDRRDDVAFSYSTGPKRLPIITPMLTRLLGGPPEEIAPAMNSPQGMDAVIPAAGVFASARDANRIFQMLVDGGTWNGQKILSRNTIDIATTAAGPLVFDDSLPAPIRFSPGFMLGERVASLYGFGTPDAFGHLGFTNIVCWADPSRQLSAAFINTGKAASPEAFIGMAAVTAAISAAVPVQVS
ncbi:serine hydrolase domain-containing protein [Antrihabitans stalactiti]|uniref:Beta-lactamase family protein n=1 Tax=Antrihabitans stalactiti TaxID=2584121 RepID=A0A848K3G7_9NOCA|nr:serine hydrolase domain-containing protein [Antrihabitans stalactiti]NMN93695.1 beta-lactamase family protein [Antrihabitans stalactiti]